MAEPKPFQIATVDAVCKNFGLEKSSRRFLVADEVGLGKTVVARDVIRRLAEQNSSLVVYYITSGQRVAHQNRARLIDFLPPDKQEAAVAKADRLGLIPLSARAKSPITLYALTPGTSFPGKRLRLHGGRKEERAFIAGLLGRTLPRLIRRLPEDTLRGSVRSNWDGLVTAHRQLAAKVPRSLIYAFRSALAAEFGSDLRTKMAASAKENRGRFVGRLRRALAHAVLISRPPDLVILDEFQRYRDMLGRDGREDRIVAELFKGKRDHKPAVLLLSATPYKLYATRWEESQSTESHRELFELLEFLGGDAGTKLRESAARTFMKFGNALRSIIASDTTSRKAEETQKHTAEAAQLRNALEALLTPYISRTERENASDDFAQTIRLRTTLEPNDIHAFKNLSISFKPDDKSYALPYWLSVPLPAQALGPRYQAWKRAEFHRDGALIKLTQKSKNRYAIPSAWPHPKLRALSDKIGPELLSLPWISPSIPWWTLGGPWAGLPLDPKLLLFSRFKATPQSLAALTSLDVEAKYLSRTKVGYDKVWRRRRLQAGPARHATVALFHPSPFLIHAIDPLTTFGKTVRSRRAIVRALIRRKLGLLDIKVSAETAKQSERHRPLWYLLSAIDRMDGHATTTARAWRETASADQRLLSLVEDWHKPRKVDWISGRELDELVTAAMFYPGVVIGRALLRHHKDALNPGHFAKAVQLSWYGLRTYLDNPIFWSRLPGKKPADILPRACDEGNLEAVLDEHFWIRRQSLSEGPEGLADDLRSVLGIASGSFSFHDPLNEQHKLFRVRCHAAVPFGVTDDENARNVESGERTPRSDEIRNAFNAPFWPYVLATTSVGQEGLDFHTWCRRIAHWDLCSSPLELEQREGRIQRYGGLGPVLNCRIPFRGIV
jgi:hypothetical protein